MIAIGGGLLGVGLIGGCRGSLEQVQVVLERHNRAFRALPEEEQAVLESIGVPVSADAVVSLLPTDELSLEQAREIAVRANPDIHAAFARLEASRARIAEARSRYYPTVSLTHNSTRTFQTPANRNRLATALQPRQPVPTDIGDPAFPVTTILNALAAPLLGAGSPKGNTNSFSEHSSALTASWVLFDGFAREARILGAKALYRASSASLADLRRLIVQAVDAAYYQVQLAEEQMRIAVADERFSREQFEETEKLRQAGRSTQADVDNFRVRMLDAQTSLAEASGLRETGRVVLAELLGIPDVTLPETLTLADLMPESEEQMTAPTASEWIQRALHARPDLVELTHFVENARQQLRVARGLYLPSISFSGSWGYDSSSSLRYTVQDQSSAAALEVRWDLFTGGLRKSRVSVARSLLAESEAQLGRLRLAVQSAVRQAIIDVVNAQQRILLQRESLKTAMENRRVVQSGYLAGKETLNRLNEAQRDYVTADANLVLARINLRQAWSDLSAAVAAHAGGAGGG
ncbi:MAG: TolC family protein [Phycisphaerae bacterium]